MEKKFLINPDSFRAFAYHARGNLSADGTLCQSMAYLIGYKFDDAYVSTELVFPRQESNSNNCKELSMTFILEQTRFANLRHKLYELQAANVIRKCHLFL